MRFSEIPSAQELKLLLEKAGQQKLDASVSERLRVILYFAEHESSVSETCRHFGISRSTFHRWMERFDPSDLRSLQDRTAESSYVHRTSLAEELIELIRRYRMRYPHMGKEKISELLKAEHGVEVSPSSIGRVIERRCFYFADTPLHWKKRIGRHSAENVEAAGVGVTGQISLDEWLPSFAEASEVPADTIPPVPVRTGQRPGGPNGYVRAGPQPAINPEPQRSLWRRIRRFILISSLIVNIAFIAMLLSMSLLEQARKSATQAAESIHEIQPGDSSLHAAPSEAPMP